MKLIHKSIVVVRRAARRWLQLDNRKHLRRARSSHNYVLRLLEAQTRATVEARREAGWAQYKVVDLEGYSRRLEDSLKRKARECDSLRRDLEGTYNRLVEVEELVDRLALERADALERSRDAVDVLEDYGVQLTGLVEAIEDYVSYRRA